jgi:hypothetical protein
MYKCEIEMNSFFLFCSLLYMHIIIIIIASFYLTCRLAKI